MWAAAALAQLQLAVATAATAAAVEVQPLPAAVGAASPIRIAFYNGGGTFVGSKQHERDFYTAVNTAAGNLAARANTVFHLTNMTEKTTVALLKNDAFDLVIFPGGSGTGQADALGPEGQAAVKAFVSAWGAIARRMLAA